MNDNRIEQQIYQEYDKPTKMNCREYLQLVRSLSKDLFKSNHVEVVDDALYTRALIAHMVVMLSRLVYPLIGIAYWQTAYDDLEQRREDVHYKFVESSQHILRFIVIVLLVLGVVLDIVVLKARRYAFLILYYEMIQVTIHAFMPHNYGDTGRALHTLTAAWMFLSYSCSLGKHMIAVFLTSIIATIFIWPIVFTD